MKTIIKSIKILLLFLTMGQAAQAQSFLTRTFSRTEFTQNNCSPIEVYYDLSVTGNMTNIILEDEFNISGCDVGLSISVDGSTMPAGYIFTTPVGSNPNAFRLVIPTMGGQSGTTRLTFKLNYNTCLAAKYRKVSLCSPGPTINNGITVNAIQNTCLTITNTNKWRTRLGCASLNGFNCYSYPVVIDVPINNRCGAYNLYGAASIHEITFPNGATNIQANGSLVISQSVSGNVLRVTLDPSSSVWNICNSYSFTLSAEYPCNQFADNSPVSISMTPSINGFGSYPWIFSPIEPFNCPLPQYNLYRRGRIPGFTSSHLIRYPRAQTSVVFWRRQQAGTHDAPGCENELRVGIRNSGTTTLNNIRYELSPIPAQMEVNCISGGQITQIQTGGSSLWVNVISSNLPANVSGIRWTMGTAAVPTPPQCDTNQSTSGAWSTICYRLRNSATIGSTITPCVTARFQNDTFNCEADTCNISLPNPLPVQACSPINVKPATSYPILTKSVIGSSSLFPQDVITFQIEVQNLGGSNLSTTLQDILNSNLELSNGTFNTTITYQFWDDAVGSWQSGHNGWVTSSNVTGNTMDFSVNIPGQCQQRNGCCKRWTNNRIRIRFTARVVECSQRGRFTNTARLNSPSRTARATYTIRNRNRLNAYKVNQGDITPGFGSYTTVSPGGNLDYKIVIYNNDPKIWYNPVVVDVLPHIGDFGLCGGPARNSQFNTTLRNDVTVDYTDAPSITPLTAAQIEYGSWGVAADADICPSGSYSWLSGPFANTSAKNGAFKLKFNGALRCGDTLVINVPAKVDPAALDGQLDTNWAYINQMTSASGGYGQNYFGTSSVAQIVDWQPPCCDSSFTVRHLNSQAFIYNGTNVSLSIFNLETFNNIPIQKVRASIINFAYDTEYEDCMRCNNESDNLGTLHPYMRRWPIGGLNVSSLQVNRELIWDLSNNGVPTVFSSGINVPIALQLPKQMNIPCCGGCITYCVKFELTDVNCNTCEVVRCITIKLPEPRVQPNGECEITPGTYNPRRLNLYDGEVEPDVLGDKNKLELLDFEKLRIE